MHRPDTGDRRHAHAGAPGQELLCRSSIGPPRSSELAHSEPAILRRNLGCRAPRGREHFGALVRTREVH